MRGVCGFILAIMGMYVSNNELHTRIGSWRRANA